MKKQRLPVFISLCFFQGLMMVCTCVPELDRLRAEHDIPFKTRERGHLGLSKCTQDKGLGRMRCLHKDMNPAIKLEKTKIMALLSFKVHSFSSEEGVMALLSFKVHFLCFSPRI